MALIDKLNAIGNAIRAKTGSTAQMTLDEMPVEIARIETGGSAGGSAGVNLDKYFEGGHENVVLPTAKKVKDNAFNKDPVLSSVSLLEATSIGDSAFAECVNLKTVEIPKVTSLGEYCFCECNNLESIELPKVTIIGIGAFAYCSNLESVVFSPNLQTIKEGAFAECEKLAITEFPDSAFTIEEFAFYYCQSIGSSLRFKGSVTLHGSAFDQCYGLETVTFEKLASLEDNCFADCRNLTTVNVPWAYGEVPGAPWGTNATINYNYKGD